MVLWCYWWCPILPFCARVRFLLVVYGEPPKAIVTSDLRQARVDEFLASRSLQPKSRKAYQADLRTFMDWCDLAWVDVSRRKVTQFKTFLLKDRELALSSVNCEQA